MKSPLFLPFLLIAGFVNACCSVAYATPGAAPQAQNTRVVSADGPPSADTNDVVIPGPLRSFLRMASVSQKVLPEEVLPLLARNVFTLGYRDGRPSEYLILVDRYVRQARELQTLAGSSGEIRVSNCGEAGPLLHILGYRLRQLCGQSNASLVTADAERAFVTIDSGFPLPELEAALQKGGPFSYAFSPSRVPILFTAQEWMNATTQDKRGSDDFLDVLLRDPALARLYWALSQNDPETRSVLRQSVGLRKLLHYGPILDFYGNQIAVRSGRVLVPGGQAAEAAWRELVGASPESPGDFIIHLVAKDKGWLAAYFDSLSRVSAEQQAHFVAGHRLKRTYEAFRSADPRAEAAMSSFRPAPALLILLTRLRWDSAGEPYVPGNLDTWKQILSQRTQSKVVRDWARRAKSWNDPEQLLEAMFAFSRMATDSGPLQIYLMANELDSRRPPEKRLTPATILLLADKYHQFSSWYLIFSEFPELNDDSIARFLNVAETIDSLPDHTLRGNAMGIFQANIGLWQILARQGQIRSEALNDSWQRVIQPFVQISSSAVLFDAGRDSLERVLLAATGRPDFSQDEIIDLLAGPTESSPEGQRMHKETADSIRSVLAGQRLVSLDAVLALGKGLHEMAQGAQIGDTLITLAGELREFEMPRPIFTRGERTEWAAGIYNNHHTDLQMHTDLTKVIKGPSSRQELEEARGRLTPFFRDILVGLNYAYYEPPGAQVLLNNPLFVRSHDFSGETVVGVERLWQASQLFGQGFPAGGGAHLVGSLADLPYVLADAEEDFIAPENVQALIWREMVPGLLVSATLPRWWNVSRDELHAIALYQQSGEELLTAAEQNQELRGKVLSILSDRMSPLRSERIEQAIERGQVVQLLPRLMPADTLYLTEEFRQKFPGEASTVGPANQELETLCSQHPRAVSWSRLSEDFGVPHPILTQSYARELLNVEPFPAFEGYSSRLLAESWDSSNLYWARLADEKGYSPVVLNRLVPQLTERMVEKIFASDTEDWRAVLRAMRETGEEFQQGKIALLPADGTTSQR